MSGRTWCYVEEVIAEEDLDPAEVLLLLRIADNYSVEYDNYFDVNLPKFERLTKLPESAIRARLRTLEQRGVIRQHGCNHEQVAIDFPGYAEWNRQRSGPPVPRESSYVKRVLSKSLRFAVFERDGFQCCWCGTDQDLCVDHIIAERRGGTDDLDNLQTLCRSCNSKKGIR